MIRLILFSLLIPALFILIPACRSTPDDSPYGELLSEPLYRPLTDSIGREPSNDTLYFRRAILLNTNQQTEPALADFRKAWSLRKDERYAFGISTLLFQKSADSSLQFLQEALRDLPASQLLRLSLARSLDATGRTKDALQECEAVLRSDPKQADVLQFKASLLEKSGDSTAALHMLELAYAEAPFDIELNYELAYAYAENKDPKVLRLCDSLIVKDSLGTHAEPHYYKGIYYANIGEKDKALSLFDLAIGNDYYYLNAYIEKGRILYERKKWNEALAVFQKANTLSASFPDAWYWMGQCQEALGQKAEARANYLRAWGLDNSFTEAKEAADRLGKP